MEPQLVSAQRYKNLIPGQFPWIAHTLAVGVGAVYTGGVPVCPRTRGLPYQAIDRHRCSLIGEKFRMDIQTGRMFV